MSEKRDKKTARGKCETQRETVRDHIPAKEVTAPEETVVKSFLTGSFPHLSLVSKEDESLLSKS